MNGLAVSPALIHTIPSLSLSLGCVPLSWPQWALTHTHTHTTLPWNTIRLRKQLFPLSPTLEITGRLLLKSHIFPSVRPSQGVPREMCVCVMRVVWRVAFKETYFNFNFF